MVSNGVYFLHKYSDSLQLAVFGSTRTRSNLISSIQVQSGSIKDFESEEGCLLTDLVVWVIYPLVMVGSYVADVPDAVAGS